MKTKRIQITVTEFENGNILLGYNLYENRYFIKTTNGIMVYTRNEVKEIYHIDPYSL
jgi:hypothetical protein